MLKLCKKIGEDLIINVNLKTEVAKSEVMVLGSGSLTPIELKLLNLVMSNVDYTRPNKLYSFKIKDIIQALDLTKNKDAYNRLKNAFFALQRTIFYISYEKDPQKFLSIQLLGVVIGERGEIKYEISSYLLNEIINLKSKFLKYDITNILKLRNKYLIKLYEVLKDSFEKNYRYNKKEKFEFEIEVEELRNILNIPNSYDYYKIKERILNKAQSQITSLTDIKFSFQEVKSGKKVLKLIFNVSKKKENKPLSKQSSLNLSLKGFREEIIAQYNNTNKYFIIDDNEFYIKEGLLFVNDEALKSSEALTWWKYIYKNKDKIKEIDPEELKKEALKEFNEFKELREKFINLPILVKYNNEQ